MLRFNPDSYVDIVNQVVIKSCWKINSRTGAMTICPEKIVEWDERIKTLKDIIQYWIDNKTEKLVEIIELFY